MNPTLERLNALPRAAPAGQGDPRDVERRFQRAKSRLHRELVAQLDLDRLAAAPDAAVKAEVRAFAARQARACPELLNDLERERLAEALVDEAFGLGPLEPLMNDPAVNDILCNGPDTVYVERAGRLALSDAQFADDEHLMQVIQRIAARVGRRVDGSAPMVDARLPDGSRVNAIVPPLALDGPVLSIRRFAPGFDAAALLANGTMSPSMVDLLRRAVRGRISLLISGGTGAGKTTLLNCLSAFVPDGERLVTIEDSAELRLQQRHVVRLETRPPNAEGAGEVPARDLVRNSLRMRPDRIIVGEVRGGEAFDMLQAMNTGHEGSMTTIHANSPRDALHRLEAMVLMAGCQWPVGVIGQHVQSALKLIVQIARLEGGARKVVRIAELVGHRDGRYRVRDLHGFRQFGVAGGAAVGEFFDTGKLPRFEGRLLAGAPLPVVEATALFKAHPN